MKLNEPLPQQLAQLYRQELTSAFPQRSSAPALHALPHGAGTLPGPGPVRRGGSGRLRPDLAGAGLSFALLDYLGTMAGPGPGPGRPDAGPACGALRPLPGHLGEAEAPENGGTPAGEPLRRRRLAFYQRNGFRYGGYDCALFGVHYRALIRGAADVTAEELLQVHQSIYRRHFLPALYQASYRSLRPGERPNPPGRWMEEEKDGVSQ